MRDWFGTQWEKRAGRTMAKGHHTTSTRMNIGAVVPPEHAAQDTPLASAASAAPQVDSCAGSDPWSMAECQPCEGQADMWGLDAFGKARGKGAKGGPKPPLACWMCFGLGHPRAFAPLRLAPVRPRGDRSATSAVGTSTWARTAPQKVEANS